MKRVVLPALAIFLFASAVFGQRSDKSVQEIRAVLKQWADSMVKRDMNALGKILSDDLIVTSFDGTTRGKKEELEVVKPNPNVTTHSVENRDVRIKIYGLTAVVTALTEMLFIISEKTASSKFRYTAVLVKQRGRWQIVALQTARVAAPPKAAN